MAQAVPQVTYTLRCPVGGETYPLHHYPTVYRCDCGATALPHCMQHDATMHLSNQRRVVADVAPIPWASVAVMLTVVLLVTGVMAGSLVLLNSLPQLFHTLAP